MKLSSILIKVIFLLTVFAFSACMKKATPYAPAGYISESQCLKLISGQAFEPEEVQIKPAAVTYESTEACVTSCFQTKHADAGYGVKKIEPALPNNNLPKNNYSVSNKNTAAKKKVAVVKPRPVVASSARASMDIKSINNTTTVITKPEKVAAVKQKTVSSEEIARENIIKVQNALNAKGAKIEVDGVMGDRTVRLIKAFQTMNELPVSGKVDEATAVALGIK